MSGNIKKEHNQHTTLSIPYKYYFSAVPDISPKFEKHWHNEFEINHIIEGTASFGCEEQIIVARKGDIFIFRPNQIHDISPIAEKKIYYDTLLFKMEILGHSEERAMRQVINPLNEGVFEIKLPISMGDPGYEDIKRVIDVIFCCAKKGEVLQDILFKSKLLELFYLLNIYGYIQTEQKGKENYVNIIRPALVYIEEHFAEEIAVDTLADCIPLSKSYFMHCFKKATGMSSIAYITQIRLKHACKQLAKSDKAIMQIAFESGFRNLSNFNRLFKKNIGCSPHEYRKKKARN